MEISQSRREATRHPIHHHALKRDASNLAAFGVRLRMSVTTLAAIATCSILLLCAQCGAVRLIDGGGDDGGHGDAHVQ